MKQLFYNDFKLFSFILSPLHTPSSYSFLPSYSELVLPKGGAYLTGTLWSMPLRP